MGCKSDSDSFWVYAFFLLKYLTTEKCSIDQKGMEAVYKTLLFQICAITEITLSQSDFIFVLISSCLTTTCVGLTEHNRKKLSFLMNPSSRLLSAVDKLLPLQTTPWMLMLQQSQKKSAGAPALITKVGSLCLWKSTSSSLVFSVLIWTWSDLHQSSKHSVHSLMRRVNGANTVRCSFSYCRPAFLCPLIHVW